MRGKVLRGDDRPRPLTLDDCCSRPHVLVSFSGDLSANIDSDPSECWLRNCIVESMGEAG